MLTVSESGYYRWRKRSQSRHDQEDQRLQERIVEIHQQSRGCYGSPRVASELRANGERIATKRVARLMRQAGLQGAMPPKRRVLTTDSAHRYPLAANLLNRQFRCSQPNRFWVSDITYILTSEGWLYLATVMDVFSRRIVGWSMSHRIDQDLTLSALRMAIAGRRPGAGLLHHSDRGSQYACGRYQALLRESKMVASMSRTGNCYDNAVIESWHRSLKVELVYRVRYATRQAARQSIFEYIEVFYNQRRRHSTLGYKTPAEFERLHATPS